MITINRVSTITNRGTACRYYIEGLGDDRLHILNEKSLRWHLKRMFKMSPPEVKSVMHHLGEFGYANLHKAVAA